MKNETYNGWHNYETWAIHLWIDNEQSTINYWNETATEIFENTEPDKLFTQAENAALSLADQLKEQHEENQPEVTGVYADLLNAALGAVNWQEIAKHLIDDVISEREYQNTKKAEKCL